MSEHEHDPRRCNARKPKGRGICRAFPLRGATRCRLHGGVQQQLPPGDPRRAGRPPIHGIYARALRDADMIEDVRDAAIGDLDSEIRVAKAYLARAIRSEQAGEPAPEVRAQNRSLVRDWTGIIGELTERVRRLEGTRVALTQSGKPDTIRAIDRILSEIDRIADTPDTDAP